MRDDTTKAQAEAAAGRPPDRDAIVSLNKRAQLAETLHTLLESSTHRSLHPVLSPTVLAELHGLGVTGQVLVCGTREVSYELMTLTQSLFTALVDATDIASFNWPLLVFRVPNAPLDWPLHHVLLYHEIGHALLGAKGNLPVAPLPPSLNPMSTLDLLRRVTIAKQAAVYQSTAASWLEELYADAVGLLLAGPVYIAAFCRFLGAFFPLDQASATHPPIALRIRLLSEFLAKGGFAPLLSTQLRDLIDDWVAVAKTVQSFRSNAELTPVVTALVQNVEALHPAVAALAASHVGVRAYSLGDFKDDEKRAELLRTFHIPPIERDELPQLTRAGEPLPPARIFNVAWGAFLAEMDAASVDVPRITEHYAHVVLGALDGAEALRVWTST